MSVATRGKPSSPSSPSGTSSTWLLSPSAGFELVSPPSSLWAVLPAASAISTVVVAGASVGVLESSAMISAVCTGDSAVVSTTLVSSASPVDCLASVTATGSPILPVPSLLLSRLTVVRGNNHNFAGHLVGTRSVGATQICYFIECKTRGSLLSCFLSSTRACREAQVHAFFARYYVQVKIA